MWSYFEDWSKQVVQETRYKFRKGELESLFEQGYTVGDAIVWGDRKEFEEWYDERRRRSVLLNDQG
jgi:hypothetical protein